jgi:hypothetical protein
MLIERPSMLKKVEREIAVMKALDHPNVLHLLDVYESSEFLYVAILFFECLRIYFAIPVGCLCWNMWKEANCLISWSPAEY